MSSLRLLNLAVAGLMWLVSAYCIFYVVYCYSFKSPIEIPLVGRMLNQSHPREWLIPLAILIVLTWVLIQLALRARDVWMQHQALPGFEAAIDGRSTLPIGRTTGHSDSRSQRRAALIRDLQRKGDAAPQEWVVSAASLDAGVLSGQYRWLHVYAWLLPVLGFIGTAIGMAAAISGFSSALGENPGASILVNRLSQLVIPGLASAFDTTVLALLASLLTYYCTSALEGADQEALDDLDALSLNYLAKSTASGSSPRNNTEPIVQLLSEISNHVRSTASAPSELRASIEGAQKASLALEEAAQALSKAAQELHASIALPYNITITRGHANE